jgi:hypothetical protein
MYFDRNPNGVECIRSIGIMGTSDIHYILSECDYALGIHMTIGKEWRLALRYISKNFLEIGENIREFGRRSTWR